MQKGKALATKKTATETDTNRERDEDPAVTSSEEQTEPKAKAAPPADPASSTDAGDDQGDKKPKVEVLEETPDDPRMAAGQEGLDRYLAAYEQLGCEDSHAGQAFESLAVDFPGDSLVAYHAKRIAAGHDSKVIVLQEK